jgi:hypothetical protein
VEGLDRIPHKEPTMISLRVLSAAAAMALVLPMMVPGAGHAQEGFHRADNPAYRGGAAPSGGGTAYAPGGGAPLIRGGGGSVPQGYSGGVPPVYNGGGGVPQQRYYGGHRRGGGGGFIPGAIAGAVIGGAITGYPGYAYPPGYYDDGYYDQGPVVVVPYGDDAVAYCMQTYRSYDPRSGTYLGYDGLRHPCP